MLEAVTITGDTLTVADLLRVARDRARVELGPDVPARVRESRAVVERSLDGEPVYGLTTGVGVRKRFRVAPADLPAFNRRLILEHRVGQGDAAPTDVVRAQLLLTVNAFARGAAGVRLELVERLVTALNDEVLPVVRTLGSLGEADLPANADLADGVLGDFELAAKEGHALLSHSSFSTAAAALAFADADRLLASFDVVAALDFEAFAANPSPIDPAVARERPFPGIAATIARLQAALEGSYLWTGAPRNLQDPLSFRCVPQLHGAARDAFAFAGRQLEIELNASQSNPLLLAGEARFVSAGNFDVLPLAAALDVMRIALAPVLTSASERAVKLLQAPLTGLPEGLASEPELAESALSEFAVPVQAFAAEAKLLAQPVSIETASTSHHEGIEDRVTLAPLAARRLAQMAELGERIAAIELVLAAQAVDLRGRPVLGGATAKAYDAVRALVPPLARGEAPPQDLEPVRELVRSGGLG